MCVMLTKVPARLGIAKLTKSRQGSFWSQTDTLCPSRVFAWTRIGPMLSGSSRSQGRQRRGAVHWDGELFLQVHSQIFGNRGAPEPVEKKMREVPMGSGTTGHFCRLKRRG